ncbi:RNA polymerase sigma factor [Myxococcus landrumensis]|uniref:RNA polymerase sigma factor n=1 Tax=Myxococcus landrumensis TaxID=2813577 RepID=A0ABX7N066_9BACT|nr:RNA polymerase sigma factor [Myxococcus landrumus]QSQ11014.1 RNA polymerase sigma factor [Myxococcus landrumus]
MANLFNRERRRFEAFIRQHRPSLLGLARRLSARSSLEPEDLVQETFERAMQEFESLKDRTDAAAAAWLCTTMTNRFLDYCRRQRTEVRGMPHLALVQEGVAQAESQENWELVSTEEFQKAVERLKPHLRDAYRLHAEGRRYNAIAEHFNVPVGTVGSWLTLARRDLKDLLLPQVAVARERGATSS